MRRLIFVAIAIFSCLVLLSADSFARGGRGGGRGGMGRGGGRGGMRGGGRGGRGRTGGMRSGRGRRGGRGNRGPNGNNAKEQQELQRTEDRMAQIKERRQALIDAARKELMERRSAAERSEAVARLADPK